MRLCSFEGCSKKHYGRGFCSQHYQRVWKHGTPEYVGESREEMAERFWSHVDRGAKDVCWLWRGTVGPTGYGMFSAKRFKPKAYRTHRLAWELTHGPIPEGLWILHHCDTPLCVNPAHLYAGTRQDNWDDVVARDRRKGERSPSAKLTDTQVREIRAIYAAGGISQRALAKQYGISNSTIDLVVRRVRWTHI